MNDPIKNAPVNLACRCMYYADAALFAVQMRKWKQPDDCFGKLEEYITELMTGKVSYAYNQQRNQVDKL